jgi:hypothetical protein
MMLMVFVNNDYLKDIYIEKSSTAVRHIIRPGGTIVSQQCENKSYLAVYQAVVLQ